MQEHTAHGPATNDHVHDAVPLETAFDFLNTLELENGALVERLTSLDAAADWLVEPASVGDRNWIADAAAPQATREAAAPAP